MDRTILLNAVNRAIADGASAAPLIDSLGLDGSLVNVQTNIALDSATFDSYVADLRADADMAAFDGMFANGPHGGGVSVGLANIARLLLARAIATNDAPGTVDRFIAYVADNMADATAVVAISGVIAAKEIKLGPDISLMPTTHLQPSIQRGIALGQGPLAATMGPRFAIPCAITTDFRFGPIFYRPKNPQPKNEMSAYVSTSVALSHLEEAVDLMSLVDVYPRIQMSWVNAKDWLMATGITSGWQTSGLDDHFGPDPDVPAEEIEPLAAAYFSIDSKLRRTALRIPLNRLAKAGHERDFSDQAIDLGIALESLLLHDLKEHTELSYRISLRGAWLIGKDVADRAEIQKVLRDLYALRSGAVHSGFIESTPKNTATLRRGAQICQSLVRRVIELKCKVDWQRAVLGATDI